MKKFVMNCAECKEQKKASNCRICHYYWVSKYQAMYKAQASAQGKNGALQAKTNIAQAKTKSLRSDLRDLQQRNDQLFRTINKGRSTIENSKRLRKKRTIQEVWDILEDTKWQ